MMKVLVSGSTGMVGTALVYHLKSNGYQVVRLVRHKLNSDEPRIGREIAKKQLNPADLVGIDAGIHLAGENLVSGRWTPEQKDKILHSRVEATRLIAETLAGMENPPKIFICASAV